MREQGPGGPGEGPSADEAKPIEYEVCGVASVPGWLWMAKLSGVRKYGYRSGALMFAPYKTVQNDFKLNDAAYFWFERTLDPSGGPTVSDADLERSIRKLVDGKSHLDDGAAAISRPMVKVSSHEYLNDRVGSRGESVIQAAAKLPLILLMISSLGVMGTVAASIRTRRFELGVLRCLGITRFGLVRLILAEALLIALERRLDNVIHKLGFASSGRQARQMVTHGHITINGRKTNIPSYQVREGEEVALKVKARQNPFVQAAMEAARSRGVPRWLELDADQFKGKVVALPTREDVSLPVQEQLIVELYSK